MHQATRSHTRADAYSVLRSLSKSLDVKQALCQTGHVTTLLWQTGDPKIEPRFCSSETENW